MSIILSIAALSSIWDRMKINCSLISRSAKVPYRLPISAPVASLRWPIQKRAFLRRSMDSRVFRATSVRNLVPPGPSDCPTENRIRSLIPASVTLGYSEIR